MRRVNYYMYILQELTQAYNYSFYLFIYITIGHALVLIMVRTLRLPPPWRIYAYMHDYSCYMTVTVLYTDNYNIIIKTVN